MGSREMENTPPAGTEGPPVLSSITVPGGELLSEEETYFKKLLEEQCTAVSRYRFQIRVFLIAGGAIILGSGVWIGFHISSVSSIGSLLSSYISFGGGLILTSASAFPYKEILNRKNKVITYKNLLEVICKIRNEGGKKPEDLERIKAKYNTITELMLKEC